MGKVEDFMVGGGLGEVRRFAREMRGKGCGMSGAAARTGKERY